MNTLNGCGFVNDLRRQNAKLRLDASAADKIIRAVQKERQRLRKAKQYEQADVLREILRTAGVPVNDRGSE